MVFRSLFLFIGNLLWPANGSLELSVLLLLPLTASKLLWWQKGRLRLFKFMYLNTFSSVAKITSVRLFLSLLAIYHGSLCQFYIKNEFLCDDQLEEVMQRKLLGVVAQEETRLLYQLKIFV